MADRRGGMPGTGGALLLRQAALGEFDDPGPRPLPEPDPVLRWGRPALLPASSIMRVRTTDPVVALTYDDGPDPDQTPALLDVLADARVSATFFVLTDAAEAHPQIVRRMLAEGHEVALHGINHERMTALPGYEAARRVRVARARLQAVTGQPVRFYRPAYGSLGPIAFATARLLGMQVVIWSAWARDWSDAPAREVADRAVHTLHDGAILLLHDTTADEEARRAGPLPTFSRAEVTGMVLEGARDRGYSFTTVGDLLRRFPTVRSLTVSRPRLHR